MFVAPGNSHFRGGRAGEPRQLVRVGPAAHLECAGRRWAAPVPGVDCRLPALAASPLRIWTVGRWPSPQTLFPWLLLATVTSGSACPYPPHRRPASRGFRPGEAVSRWGPLCPRTTAGRAPGPSRRLRGACETAMVLLHVKRGDESQFLLQASGNTELEELTVQVTRVYNARLKVQRICSGGSAARASVGPGPLGSEEVAGTHTSASGRPGARVHFVKMCIRGA